MDITEKTRVPLFAVLIAAVAVITAVAWFVSVGDRASAAQETAISADIKSVRALEEISGIKANISDIKSGIHRIETKLDEAR